MRVLSVKTLDAQDIQTRRGVAFDALPGLPDEFHLVWVAISMTFNSLADTTRDIRIFSEKSNGTVLYGDTTIELTNRDEIEPNFAIVGPFIIPASEIFRVGVSSNQADVDTDLVFRLLSGDAEYYQAYSVPSAPFTADSLQQLVQALSTLLSDGGDGDAKAIKTAAERLTAARAATLTDWINNGRLDLLLDAVLLDTGTTLPGLIAADVTTDAASRTASKATGFATPANVAAAHSTTDGLIADVPTVAEFNARTIVAASYFDPSSDEVITDTASRTASKATGFATPANVVSAHSTTDALIEAVKAITDALTAAAAAKLALSAGTIVTGTAVAGTLSTTQMTSDLSEATNNHYIGRVLIWTSGVLKNQGAEITDYAGANGLLTYAATTEAPSADDTFIIL